MTNWKQPVIINLKGKQRTFYISTTKNLLPKGNEHWFTVHVYEFAGLSPAVSFDFLHHIVSRQTEISRFHSLMPLKEIYEEMHKRVGEGNETW